MQTLFQYMKNDLSDQRKIEKQISECELPLMHICIQIRDVIVIPIFIDTNEQMITALIKQKRPNLDDSQINKICIKCVEQINQYLDMLDKSIKLKPITKGDIFYLQALTNQKQIIQKGISVKRKEIKNGWIFYEVLVGGIAYSTQFSKFKMQQFLNTCKLQNFGKPHKINFLECQDFNRSLDTFISTYRLDVNTRQQLILYLNDDLQNL